MLNAVKTDLNKPAGWWVSATNVDGVPAKRLAVVLRASGCTYALRTRNHCVFCGFLGATTRGTPVPADSLVNQFEYALGKRNLTKDEIREVDIYNSGSFFNDKEISGEARAGILGRLKRLGECESVEVVLVESRPEYIREEKVSLAKSLVGDRRLQVGIGLESANDHLREKVLRKGFSKKQFEKALAALRAAGAEVLVYVLIKPPGLEELESIEDAVETARYVFSLSQSMGVSATVALEPACVTKGTPLHKQYIGKKYSPPWLWTVVEVVNRIGKLGSVFVGSSNDEPKPVAAPKNCERCTTRVERALERFNATRDLGEFLGLSCECQARWRSLCGM